LYGPAYYNLINPLFVFAAYAFITPIPFEENLEDYIFIFHYY